jgi:hypothetical protein
MRRLIVLVVLACVGVTAFASATPTASGQASDAWLTTRTAAVHKLAGRFKDVAAVRCVPDRSSATQVFGTTRYWQRFSCSGRTYDRVAFRLRFKATGQCEGCWTISNLSGLSVSHLRVRHVVSAQSSSSGTGSTSCGADYYRNSSGDCVHRPSSDPTGATALCVDGSYSYSEHASGTCSHHGGVARWINHPS